MAFSVSTLKGVKVYNLTFGKTAEQWKEEQRQGHVNSLRYNEAFRRRVEFIQDAVFPVASTKVCVSEDCEWMIATGLYPPKLKVFDLNHLSMKFERGLETEALDVCILTEDFSKFSVLREDRWLEFHTRHGRHYNMRLPVPGTQLAYNPPMCELYIATVKNIVLRANLEKGRYFAPFETKVEHISGADVDRTHLLCCFGGSNGLFECWDPRSREKVAGVDLYDSCPSLIPTPDISRVRFGDDGLSLAIGTSGGHSLIYDLRKLQPLHILNQRNSQRINEIHFHSHSSKIITSDRKSIRYWNTDGASIGLSHAHSSVSSHSRDRSNRNSDALYTVITPDQPVNGFAPVGRSGVIFVATEQHRIGAYYVPSVGLSPKWCPFLDSMTEELSEKKNRELYANYKFVSRDELEALGLEHLIGTNLLKPYMHGFYMDLRLYRRIRSIVDPNTYASFLRRKTKEKIDDQRSDRIMVKSAMVESAEQMGDDGNDSDSDNDGSEGEEGRRTMERGRDTHTLSSSSVLRAKLPKVNQEYAKELIRRSKEGQINESDCDMTGFQTGTGVPSAMFDPRFSSLFKNRDFEIDMTHDYYLKFHPEIRYAMKGSDYQELSQIVSEIGKNTGDVRKKRTQSEMEQTSLYLKNEQTRMGKSMLPQMIIDEDTLDEGGTRAQTLDEQLWRQKIREESTQYDMLRYRDTFGEDMLKDEGVHSMDTSNFRTLDDHREGESEGDSSE